MLVVPVRGERELKLVKTSRTQNRVADFQPYVQGGSN